MTEGKKKELQAVADARGVIAALAIDQRSAMQKLFAQAMGREPVAVPADKIVQVKEAVSRILTPHASAILLDPEYGLPAAKKDKKAGLLLAYEQTGYAKRVPGRLPKLLEQWTVNRLVSAEAECADADVPFFLELVSYGEGMDDKGPQYNVNRCLKAAKPWFTDGAEPRKQKSVRSKGKGRL